MKTIITKRFTLLFSLLMVMSTMGYSAAFTAIASGDWSSSATWGGTAPSFTNTTDQVTIPSGLTVTLDNEYTMNGLLAELKVNGTLNSSSTVGINIIYGTLSGTGTIDVGSCTFGGSSVFLFTGMFTTGSLSNSMANLQVGSNTNITNTLTLSNGVFSIQPGGTLTMANNSSVILMGGSLLNNGGNLSLGSAYNVTYSGSSDVNTGLELSGSGLNNVTIDVGSQNSVAMSDDLTVKGTLTLASGTLNLNDNHLTITGNVAPSGTGTIKTSATSDLTLASSSGITGTLRFGGGQHPLNNFVVNVGSFNQAAILGDLKINGTLNLSSGILKLESSNLEITGNIASGTGTISSTGNSGINVNTAATPTGSLQFTTGSNTITNFSVNVANGGYVVVNSDLVVSNNLNMVYGRLDMNNHKLTIGSAATVTGYNSNAYIITGSTGSLAMSLTAGSATTTYFPIGTSTLYFPATVKLNAGSNSGTVMASVMPNVYAEGTTGLDLSLMQHAVDATWDIKSDVSSNLNMDLQLMWNTAAEVNGFDRSSCYISHYISSNWDASAKVAATSQGAGMYSCTRTNITTLSPFAVFDNSTNTGVININRDRIAIGLYPNPAAETLYINHADLAAGKELTVELMNTSGQVLSTSEISGSNNSIPVGQLPAGVYFIRIDNAIHKFTKM